MEVGQTAETATRQPVTPAKKTEGPKDPSRRRLILKGLRIAGAVAAAELGMAAGLAAFPTVDRFIKSLEGSPKKPTSEIPPPVEPNKPPAEKIINKVRLAELTEKVGYMFMLPLPFKTTAEDPYGFVLDFQDLTIVDVKDAETPDGLWVALAMPGNVLQRQADGDPATNFDGTKTQLYNYRGFTPWIYVDGRTRVAQKGTTVGLGHGVATLKPSLEIGKTISFSSYITQDGERTFRDTNLKSFQLLSENLGKPNLDRSDQTFKFVANDVTINPLQE